MADTDNGADISQDKIKMAEVLRDLLKEISKLEGKSAEDNKKTVEELQKEKDLLLFKIEGLKQTGASEEEISKQKQKAYEKELEMVHKLAEEAGEYNDDHIKRIKEINKELKNEEEIVKKINEHEKERGKLQESIKKGIGDTVKGIGGLLKPLTDSLTKAMGLNKEFEGVSRGIGSILSGNIITGLFQIAGAGVEFYMDRLNAVADLVEKTRASTVSATGQIQRTITTFGASLMEYGIGIEKLADSSTSLFTGMSKFSTLNFGLQRDLVKNAALMANLGVSTQTTAKNFNILTSSLHINASRVDDINNKMAKAAIAAGIAPRKMLEEFATAMPQLAAHGAKAVDIYISMQRQAKSLGMELSALNSIVGEQFDTFEGSARAAGKLNAMLGGNYLNSVEMLNATEEERVVMLKQAFEQAGMNYDQMDKHSRKAIAGAIAGGDVEKLNQFMGVSSKELKADTKKVEAPQAQLDQAQRDAATRDQKNAIAQEALMDQAVKYNNFLNEQAAISRQIQVDTLNKMTEGINNVKSKIEEFIGWLKENSTGVIIAAGVGVGIFALIKLIGVIKTVKGWFSGASAAASTTSESIGSAGASAGRSAGQWLALGAAFLMIGAGVAIAAFGVSELVKSFQGLTGPQAIGAVLAIVGLMWGLVAVVGALGAIGPAAAPGILAVAVALALMTIPILGIGKALEWAAPVINTFINGIASIINKFLEVVGSIINAIIGAIPEIISSVGKLIKFVGEGFGAVFNGLANLIKELLFGIAEILKNSSPSSVGSIIALAGAIFTLSAAFAGAAAVGIIGGVLNWIAGAMGQSLPEKIKEFVDASNQLSAEKINSFAQAVVGLQRLAETKVSNDSVLGSIGNFSNMINPLVNQISNLSSSLLALEGPISVFQKLAGYIRDVRTELEGVSADSIEKLKTFSDTMQNTRTLTSEELRPASEFVQIMKSYYDAQAQAKSSSEDAIVQALKEATKSIVGELQTGRQQGQSINLNIRGSGGGNDFSTTLHELTHR